MHITVDHNDEHVTEVQEHTMDVIKWVRDPPSDSREKKWSG